MLDGIVPYPAAAAAHYRAAGLWGNRTIAEEFRACAARFADREAVVDARERLTYAQLDRHADLVAAGLLDLGLEPGDRAILQLTNSVHTVVAWYALLKAGILPVCTLALHRHHEIDQIAAQTGARVHLVQSDWAKFDLLAFAAEVAERVPSLERVVSVGGGGGDARLEDWYEGDADAARARVDDVQASIGPDDPAVMQLSGGTTSVPKVIPRLHAEYWYNGRAYAEALGWDADVRVIHPLPLVHNAGISCAVHPAHAVGATTVVSEGLDPAVFVPMVMRERVTDSLASLAVAQALLGNEQAREAFASVRRLTFAGSHLPEPVARAMAGAGFHVLQLFGMGEGMFILTPPDAPEAMRLRTVGMPMSALDEVRILVPGTEETALRGEEGELCCRGPYTIRGYFAAPEHNRAAFTSDGFYRTGDVAREQVVDGRVCYSIEGRLKDLINRGAEKINAAEVEEILVGHPAIAAAALVAMPDERLGERACAYVVARAGSDPVALPDLQAFLEERGLAKFKWPERLEWVPELATTNTGKVDKKRLRERIAAAVERESAAPAGV